MTPAVLVGVGVGPGDPELLTLRALRVLREADRVFAPSLAVDAVGRAESIVRGADPAIAVERVVFAVNGDAATRAGAHDLAAARVVECLAAGQRVAFVTLGDPNIYSTFHHLASAVQRLRPGTAVETVAGIMAFQDLAARAGVVVVDGAERLAVVSAADGPGPLHAALADTDAALVVYKGGRHLPAIAERLARAGRLDGAVFGELLGLPGQRVGAVADAAARPAAYLATVIVPPARAEGGA
ncbi:MAG TPA: precorrin-2 C(20)-methyltransferase [Acidimicrobiales bacterium]|jgi:precorrin-2/cobalt-factor-2 C20-methyltransferase|nr:precorrin-2 C(20)-methyltransferase [Acidimicrobiales bacterium]